MSMHGAGQCRICGAWSDYCTLDTAAGPSVDCRDLMLRPGVEPLHPEREDPPASAFQNPESSRTGRPS